MQNYISHIILQTATIKEAMIALNRLTDEVMTLLVTDDKGIMQGTVTDGDIRRGLIGEKSQNDPVTEIMFRSFHYFSDTNFSIDLIREYRNRKYSLIPYLNADGSIRNVYDLRKKRSVLPVDAILMAGGKGERLRPLTEKEPKPLLKVGNKAIIDHNVDRLMAFGIEHFYITVNYLADQIISHFERRPEKEIHFCCVKEEQCLGTMGGISLIKSLHHDTVLIMNSDLFTNIDYEDFYSEFIRENADMAIATVPYDVNVPYAIMQLSGNEVVGLEEKPNYTFYANAGIYLIKKEFLALIPRNAKFDATDMIELLIKMKKRVVKFPIMGYWLDIGKHDDFNKAQEWVKHKKE